MAIYKSVKDLNKYLQKQVNELLDKKLAFGVKDYIQESVDENVYEVYEPIKYERRGFSPTSEGIGGKSQMNHTVTKDGLLTVTDDAKSNPNYPDVPKGYDVNKSLAENIEYGYGQLPWNKPRPFIEKAKENLKKDKYMEELLKEGLEDKGFKVD